MADNLDENWATPKENDTNEMKRKKDGSISSNHNVKAKKIKLSDVSNCNKNKENSIVEISEEKNIPPIAEDDRDISAKKKKKKLKNSKTNGTNELQRREVIVSMETSNTIYDGSTIIKSLLNIIEFVEPSTEIVEAVGVDDVDCIAGDGLEGNVELDRLEEDIEDVQNFKIEKKEKKKLDKDKRTKHKKKPSKNPDMQAINLTTPNSLISFVNDTCKMTMTSVQLDGVQLKNENICLCNESDHTIVSFIRTLFPKWKTVFKENVDLQRRPIILIVSSSAIRCVELIKQLKLFKEAGFTIAKLFAKHIKLEDTEKFLQKKVVHIGIGTPNRILQLLDNGDLSLECLRSTILDWTYKDAKGYTMNRLHIVSTNLLDLLIKHIIPNVKSNNSHSKISLF